MTPTEAAILQVLEVMTTSLENMATNQVLTAQLLEAILTVLTAGMCEDGGAEPRVQRDS